MSGNYEQLFLLEVLVDNVKLLSEILKKYAEENEDDADEKPLRLRVKFSEFPCFEIVQDLAPPDKPPARTSQDEEDPTDCIAFNCGKSCMFPMDPEQLLIDLVKYPLTVTAFKKTQDMPLPNVIGQTKVFLTEAMTPIVKQASEWALDEPISEIVKDQFPVKNSADQDVGVINLLVRMTCFGKTIVTKFQIADNKKAFMFKNAKKTDNEFKCKKCMPNQRIIRQAIEDRPEEEQEQEDKDKASSVTEEMLEAVDSVPAVGPSARQLPPEEVTTHPDRGLIERKVLSGPGFEATMEVRYPEQDEEDSPLKRKKRGRRRRKGEVEEITNGVSLGKKKPRQLSIFCQRSPINFYPGVVRGHKWCIGGGGGDKIPAVHGWNWKGRAPLGIKPEEMRGWTPGCFLKSCWKIMEQVKNFKPEKRRRRKKPCVDDRKPTLHIHRIKGVYHVTMNPPQKPGDKEPPEPVTYTLKPNEFDSEESDLELDLTLPDEPPAPPPVLKHQAQQFCESDLPLPQPKKVKVKKERKAKAKPKGKGKKDKDAKKKNKGTMSTKSSRTTMSKEEKEQIVKKYDKWIMGLKCKRQKQSK